jgi:hypothetical protein
MNMFGKISVRLNFKEGVFMSCREIKDLDSIVAEMLDKGENMDSHMDDLPLEPAKHNGKWGIIDPKNGFIPTPPTKLTDEIRRDPKSAIKNRKGRIKILSNLLEKTDDLEEQATLSQEIEKTKAELAKIMTFAKSHALHKTSH